MSNKAHEPKQQSKSKQVVNKKKQHTLWQRLMGRRHHNNSKKDGHTYPFMSIAKCLQTFDWYCTERENLGIGHSWEKQDLGHSNQRQSHRRETLNKHKGQQNKKWEA